MQILSFNFKTLIIYNSDILSRNNCMARHTNFGESLKTNLAENKLAEYWHESCLIGEERNHYREQHDNLPLPC